MHKKIILEQVVQGTHEEPVMALVELYKAGEVTMEEIQFQLTIPPKLKAMVWDVISMEEILTAQEASELWGLNESTLRKAFGNKDARFNSGEYRKSGKIWLVKRSAMERVYGRLE